MVLIYCIVSAFFLVKNPLPKTITGKYFFTISCTLGGDYGQKIECG